MHPTAANADTRPDPRDGAPILGQIQLELTSRCNLRCRTCLYPHYESQWMARDLSQRLFDCLLASAPPCAAMHLQGWGESLMRPDVAGCIQAVAGTGIKATLSSNGSHMTPELARDLIDAGLYSMTFSLAGVNAQHQDPLRGNGSFASAVNSIATFAAQRGGSKIPALLVNYLLTPDSYPRLPKALALCSRLGVDTLVATHLVHVCTDDQVRLAAFGTGHPPRWALLRSRLSVLWRRTALILPGTVESPLPVCEKNPLKNLFIGSDGAVSPCVYLCPPINGALNRFVAGGIVRMQRVVMGNLNQLTLDRIWRMPDYVAFRQAFQRRQALYDALIPPVQTDFKGLENLERAVAEIRRCFREDAYQPPAPCRGCVHLIGY
jgi:MoaA/NifB/PqqE/SkfB family radical SAM enzyme